MRGITSLIENQGLMQLIASPHLSEEDINAIDAGYKSRDDIIAQSLNAAIPDTLDSNSNQSQWECLAWMISKGMLDIKIAVAPH